MFKFFYQQLHTSYIFSFFYPGGKFFLLEFKHSLMFSPMMTISLMSILRREKVVFLLVVSSSTISSSSLLTDTTKQSRECADVTVGSNLEKIFDVFVRDSSASVYVVGLYMTSTPTFYDDANFLCICNGDTMRILFFPDSSISSSQRKNLRCFSHIGSGDDANFLCNRN